MCLLLREGAQACKASASPGCMLCCPLRGQDRLAQVVWAQMLWSAGGRMHGCRAGPGCRGSGTDPPRPLVPHRHLGVQRGSKLVVAGRAVAGKLRVQLALGQLGDSSGHWRVAHVVGEVVVVAAVCSHSGLHGER